MTWLAFSLVALPLVAAPRVDGSVVDSRTNRGVHSVEVSIYSWESGQPALAAKLSTDADGGFEVPADVPGPFSASLFDPATQTPLGRAPRSGQLAQVPDPWRVEVDLGPTLPFRLGNGTEDAREWRLRLVERDANGRERVWPWRAAQVGDAAWIRYPRYEYEPDARFTRFLEAQIRGRDRSGTGRVPEDGGVTSLALVPLGALGGRALFEDSDLAAAAVAVRAVPLDRPERWDDPRSWPATRTSDRGEFALAGLEPGRYLLCAEKSGATLGRAEVSVEGPTAVDLALRGGPHALRVTVDGTGAMGWLTLFGGPDTGRAEAPLRDDSFPFVQRVPARPGSASEFRFDGLASGPYTVSFQDSRGGPEDRQTVRVQQPPVELSGKGRAKLEDDPVELFVEAGPSSTSRFELRSSDGAPLSETYLQIWTDSLWFPEMLADTPVAFGAEGFHWAAGARGYRPVLGQADEPGTFTATLEPGWGVRLLVRSTDHLEFPAPDDWATYVESHRTAPPLAGVGVLVDGVEAGFTDEHGALWIEGAGPPEQVSLEHSTMAVVASPLFRDGHVLGTSAEVVVWMRSTRAH